MDRNEALSILERHHEELRQHSVASMSVFGSVARDEASAASDIDLLVEFDKPVGLFAFLRLRQFLEGLLGRKVDLVTPDALGEPLRRRVLAEAIRAA